MSEVVDFMSCSIGSNQLESIFVDDDANSKSKSNSCAMKPFPLNNENENEIDMDAKAGEWIGILVNKKFGKKLCMGEVVSYCGETKLFKIVYETYVSEEVDYQGLQKIVAPPSVVTQYLEDNHRREMELKRKKELQQEDTWFPVHPRYPSSTYQKPVKPRRKKRSKGETSTSTYIPLAYRETKRDDYIYY